MEDIFDRVLKGVEMLEFRQSRCSKEPEFETTSITYI